MLLFSNAECRRLILGSICAAASFCCSGCSEDLGIKQPSYKAHSSATEAIALFDTNKNGSLEVAELAASPGLNAVLNRWDTDHNQALSKSEIEQRIQSYADDGGLAIPVQLKITLNGQPLSDAEIVFQPEPFLEKTIVRATAVADAQGLASLRIENAELAAANLGLYRVSISKKNPQGQEMVPAKYNTQTILGQEVASDVPDFERGLTFALTNP